MTSNWTDAQDKQLEEGLAQYPSSMDKNERWTAIAAGVGGRSKKDCVARFKEIRLALLQKQQQAAAEGGTGAAAANEGGVGSSRSDDASSSLVVTSEDKEKQVSGKADTVTSRSTSSGSGSSRGLLIPGQAVNRANHRRASGGSCGGGDNNCAGEDKKSARMGAAAAPLDARATEFVPPSKPRGPDTASDTTTASVASGKKKGNRGRGKGKKADVNQQITDTTDDGAQNKGQGQQQQKQQQPQHQQNAKGKKKKGGKAIDLPPAEQEGQGGEAAKKGSKTRKKRNAKKKKSDRRGGGRFAWRNEVPPGAVDPISLDPLVDMDYQPFALVATEPYDVIEKWPVPEEEERRMELLRGAIKAGEGGEEERRRIAERELDVIREQWGDAVAASASAFSGQRTTDDDGDEKPPSVLDNGEAKVATAGSGRRYYHLFDGRVLAYYLVSQLQFIDPLNRRDLTRAELINLDNYLERHNLGRAGVTEAYDARGVTVSTAGVAGQTAEGRAEILQQEARTLLGSLFSGDSHADGSAAAQRARARATPRFQNEFQRHYVESERRQQGARGGSRTGARRQEEARLINRKMQEFMALRRVEF